MIVSRSRFLPTAIVVFLVAFIVGLGSLRTDPPAPREPRELGRVSPRRSEDDGGFSILLSRPRDAYLVGRQEVAVAPTVPAGDVIAQVDFFVDGRLIATDREAPFSTETDFGQQLKRHTILVRAVTKGGRRARVSFISRGASLTHEPSRPVASVSVRVTDSQGHRAGKMSLSDFVLSENGARQPIVHFDSDPGPLSIAVVLHAPEGSSPVRDALIGHAAALAASLPAYHAFAYSEAGASPPPVPRRPPPPAQAKDRRTEEHEAPPLPDPFTHDRSALNALLVEAAEAKDAPKPRPLAVALEEASSALKLRPRGRVLVLLLARPPAPVPAVLAAAIGADEAAQPGASAPTESPGAPQAGGTPEAPPADAAPVQEPPPPPPDPLLEAALGDVIRSEATVCVVELGDGSPADAPLRKIVEDTGGAWVTAQAIQDLGPAVDLVTDALLDRYLLSYLPAHPEHPGWRTIQVTTRRPDLIVTSRKGIHVEAAP